VGVGYGKANEVPPAVEKAIKDGMKNLIEVPVESGTIPHRIEGHSGTSKVVLLPAEPRHRRHRRRSECVPRANRPAFVTSSPRPMVRPTPSISVEAAIDALEQSRTRADVERLRGVSLASSPGHQG